MGFSDIANTNNYLEMIQGDTINVNFNLKYDREPLAIADVLWAKFTCDGLSQEVALTGLGSGLWNLFISASTSNGLAVGKYTYDITVKFVDTAVDVVTFIRNGKLTILSKDNEVV